jgi:hypothetical protein
VARTRRRTSSNAPLRPKRAAESHGDATKTDGDQELGIERLRAFDPGLARVAACEPRLHHVLDAPFPAQGRASSEIQSDRTFELRVVEPGDYELLVTHEIRRPGAILFSWTLRTEPIRVIDGDVEIEITIAD